jgi:glycosyltransferase involved in cell wall biosynthesis
MRILQLISAMGGGGAEMLTRDLALALRAEGHEVGVAYVSSASDQGNSAELEAEFIRLFAAGGVRLFEIGHRSRRNPLQGAWRLRRIVRDFKPDVLHIHLGYGLLFRAMSQLSVPTVYTHHNIVFKFSPLLLRWFDRSLSAYVAICQRCRDVLRVRTHKPVELIRNAIAPSRMATTGVVRDPSHFTLLSVGVVSPQKDYDTLIEVARILTRDMPPFARPVRFLVAGQGDNIAACQARAAAAGVGDALTFLGPRKDVPALMAAADLHLMTSRYEGLPITLIEAIHSGLPIVATDVGGCSEIVLDGVNGRLGQPGDARGLAELVAALLRDDALRQRMAEASRAHARNFAMDQFVALHRALYGKLAPKALTPDKPL